VVSRRVGDPKLGDAHAVGSFNVLEPLTDNPVVSVVDQWDGVTPTEQLSVSVLSTNEQSANE